MKKHRDLIKETFKEMRTEFLSGFRPGFWRTHALPMLQIIAFIIVIQTLITVAVLFAINGYEKPKALHPNKNSQPLISSEEITQLLSIKDWKEYTNKELGITFSIPPKANIEVAKSDKGSTITVGELNMYTGQLAQDKIKNLLGGDARGDLFNKLSIDKREVSLLAQIEWDQIFSRNSLSQNCTISTRKAKYFTELNGYTFEISLNFDISPCEEFNSPSIIPRVLTAIGIIQSVEFHNSDYVDIENPTFSKRGYTSDQLVFFGSKESMDEILNLNDNQLLPFSCSVLYRANIYSPRTNSKNYQYTLKDISYSYEQRINAFENKKHYYSNERGLDILFNLTIHQPKAKEIKDLIIKHLPTSTPINRESSPIVQRVTECSLKSVNQRSLLLFNYNENTSPVFGEINLLGWVSDTEGKKFNPAIITKPGKLWPYYGCGRILAITKDELAYVECGAGDGGYGATEIVKVNLNAREIERIFSCEKMGGKPAVCKKY